MKTPLKTNSKKYLENIENYLLDAIDLSDYDKPNATAKEKLNFLFKDFDRVANYPRNLKKFPNRQRRLADYLAGLPTFLGIAVYNDQIIDLAKNLLEVDELPEKTEGRIINNYYNFMAYHLIRLHEKLN